ncbi:homocysteine S-methyltransferase family protein [Staphylococcus xylosus]
MRLLEKLESQSPLVLDGGLATTLEQAGCNLNSSLWSSEVLKNSPVKIKEAHQSFTDAVRRYITYEYISSKLSNFFRYWTEKC